MLESIAFFLEFAIGAIFQAMASQTCKFQNFEILYTKQKTQKHKKWKDGSMQVEQDRTGNTSKSRVKLFDEDGLLLLNSVLHVPPVMCGQDLEIEQCVSL